MSLRKVPTCEGPDGSIDCELHPWPEEGWGDVARAQFQLPAHAAGESFGLLSSGAGGEDTTSGHSLPHSWGCLWSQGLPPAKLKASLTSCMQMGK